MSHPSVIARRTDHARIRIEAAAEALAQARGLDPALVAGLYVHDRDPETQKVMRQEAVASLLEALCSVPGRRTGRHQEEITGDRRVMRQAREAELEGMKTSELSEIARSLGLKPTGFKEERRAAILEREFPA
jgi:hypothetical protein